MKEKVKVKMKDLLSGSVGALRRFCFLPEWNLLKMISLLTRMPQDFLARVVLFFERLAPGNK